MKTEPVTISLKFKVGTFVFTGLLYAVLTYLMNKSTTDTASILLQSILEGLIFGLLFGFVGTSLFERFGGRLNDFLARSIKPKILDDEVILHKGGANLFRGVEAVGGKLYLTTSQLVFASHKLNLRNGQTEIELASIADVEPRKTGGIVDNRIRITIKQGDTFDFVVENREEWIEQLEEAIQ